MSTCQRPMLPTCGSETPCLVRGHTPLGVAATTFGLLTTGPKALSIDGRSIGHGLPRRLIGLHEVAAILMHPSCGFVASDAVWRLLVDRARTLGPAWVVGAVGVALPGLRAAACRLTRSFTGDVQAELVAGFITALTTVEVDSPRVAQRLCSAALVTARARLRASEPARTNVVCHALVSAAPPAPGGHPDFVLARAVRAGVLTRGEAQLIGVTRLEEVPIAVYADRIGMNQWTAYKTRARAEERLAAALAAQALDDGTADVIAQATTVLVADPVEGL